MYVLSQSKSMQYSLRISLYVFLHLRKITLNQLARYGYNIFAYKCYTNNYQMNSKLFTSLAHLEFAVIHIKTSSSSINHIHITYNKHWRNRIFSNSMHADHCDISSKDQFFFYLIYSRDKNKDTMSMWHVKIATKIR